LLKREMSSDEKVSLIEALECTRSCFGVEFSYNISIKENKLNFLF